MPEYEELQNKNRQVHSSPSARSLITSFDELVSRDALEGRRAHGPSSLLHARIKAHGQHRKITHLRYMRNCCESQHGID
jgi:hypothetical protein